jgi:ATP-binding cassette subfamily B protein
MPPQFNPGGRVPLPPPRSLRERLGALRNVPPFLALVWQTSPTLASGALLLRIVRAVLPVATLYVGKLIIDEVIALASTTGAPATLGAWLSSGVLDRLLWLLAAELALAILFDLLGRVVSLLDSLLAEQFSNITSVRLMEHAATLDLEDFEDSELQDRLDRARRQTSGRMTLTSQLFGQAQDVITIISFAAGLAAYAPWLIPLLLLALVPAFVGEAHFNAQSYALTYSRTPEQRELDYVRQTGASVETAKEVKIFGLNAFLIERYRELAEKFYQANRRLAIRRASWGSALTAIGTAGYYVAYAYLVWRTLAGQFTIGDLTFLAGSFRRLRTLLEGLLVGFSQTAGQAMYLDDLFSFFTIEPEIRTLPDARPFPVPVREGFRFENVGFIYPGAERWAVRHLDFMLRAGEVLALVGENGAGKTTLVKLLARLYDPDEGRILLDGHDLREYDLEQVRRAIGVIFQDFVRYDMRFDENVGVGEVDEVSDYLDSLPPANGDVPPSPPEAIAAAAEKSLAATLLPRLPGSYRQMLGRRFDDGVDLSGGEWQKVALARAYMRDAQLLILDEPTAALDARAEYDVFVRFNALMAGRMAIVISHRFSTVRMADRIIVLRNGEIVEQGTHDELAKAGGLYAELFDMQAAGYR